MIYTAVFLNTFATGKTLLFPFVYSLEREKSGECIPHMRCMCTLEHAHAKKHVQLCKLNQFRTHFYVYMSLSCTVSVGFQVIAASIIKGHGHAASITEIESLPHFKMCYGFKVNITSTLPVI